MKFRDPLQGQPEVPLNPQHQLLRAHVERTVAAPAVILVTSAEPGDGKSLTAHSLALCLARSGRRTALVDLTQSLAGPNLQLTASSAESRPDIPGAGPVVAGMRASRGAMTAFVDQSRAAYEYTILDSPALLSDDVAMGLAGTVDGIILAVRLGRAPSDLDGLTLRLIERSEGRVIGVVATLPDAVADFGRRTKGEPVVELERPRAAASNVSWIGRIRAATFAVVASIVLTCGATVSILGLPDKPGFWSTVRTAAGNSIEPARNCRFASRRDSAIRTGPRTPAVRPF